MKAVPLNLTGKGNTNEEFHSAQIKFIESVKELFEKAGYKVRNYSTCYTYGHGDLQEQINIQCVNEPKVIFIFDSVGGKLLDRQKEPCDLHANFFNHSSLEFDKAFDLLLRAIRGY